MEIIISGFIGLISGAVGSLIAPWVHWRIEKNKLRLLAQRELLKNVRQALHGTTYEKNSFRESVVYSQIKPFLREDVQKMIESDRITINLQGRGAGVNSYKIRILDNLCELEKKWKLL